jgi:iron complex outermembrane receptor protein
MVLRFVVALALSPLSALAQEAPPRLPPVRVEAEVESDDRTRAEERAREDIQRVPGSVDVIGQQAINESRGANLKDVLDFTPGVMIRPRLGGAADESQFSIRGSGLRNNFHLRGVNVLIDGFPFGNADGFGDFEAFELLDTKRIEVYKGGNALRFGGNTLGGAVNLITKTGHDAGLFEIRSEAGSFGFLKNHLATGQVYGPLDLYVGASDTEVDGYRDHSMQTRRRLYTTLGYRLGGGTTLRLDFNYVKSEEELPGALTREEFIRNPRQRNPVNAPFNEARNQDYARGAFTVRAPISAFQALEWSTQLNYQDLDHPLAFAVIDDTTYSWSTELRYLLTAPLLGFGSRFTAGLQYFSTRQEDVNFANVFGRRGAKTKDQLNIATNYGAYAEEQFDVTPWLTLVAGARAQYSRRAVRDNFFSEQQPGTTAPDVDLNDSGVVDFTSLTPKVGFIARPTSTVQVYGNASESHEPPLLLELTSPGRFQAPLGSLHSQRAWQFEVGTRGTAGTRIAWDVAVYDIEVWREILAVNVPVVAPFFTFTVPGFVNATRSRHTGVEAGGTVVLMRDIAPALGLGTTGDALRAHVAYTWSRFVFVDDPLFNNNNLPGAPRHFIRAELRYDHLSGAWLAPGIEVVPNGYFVDNENTTRTPHYTLVNVRAGWDYAPWQLGVFFEARNVTDKQYVSSVVVNDATRRFFEPGDGRAFYGGVSWRWK